MAARRFQITLRAERQLVAAESWWQAHRDKAPDAFTDDIAAALEQIRSRPNSGLRVPMTRRRGVRRVILERIGYAVYYRVDRNGNVTILTIWHMSRRRPPRL